MGPCILSLLLFASAAVTEGPTVERLGELMKDNPTLTRNRLADESSPYLLQHKDNPVHWQPWGDEAWELARKLDRPVFLSIGYATCHWCHVMEHESFEDPEVAQLMNDAFVNVKVDREERPDVDHVYMTVCQLMTGSGGWPLSIVMTAEGKAFYAGTYIPKDARYGRPGMRQLIPQISQLWQEDRAQIDKVAASVTSNLLKTQETGGTGELDPGTLQRAGKELSSRYDEQWGGFGTGMKFPTPHNLSFLLRQHKAEKDAHSLVMVEKTLQEMRKGGLWDHVGFGFHRYSTDPQWLVPHFEKMLYDQALLLQAYLEAYQVTGNEGYAAVVRDIATYVLRDLTSPEGAFYSAEDADSEGKEGLFYLWSLEELKQLLGTADAAWAMEHYQVGESPNFVDPHTPGHSGHILHGPGPELNPRREAVRLQLFAARSKRIRPLLDDKVLADWNGLMIGALAAAGAALQEPEYVNAAVKAMGFIEDNMTTEDGRLLHRYRAGDAAIPGTLDDHAFVAWASLELYSATFDPRYLERALLLAGQITERFKAPGGGYYMTADDAHELLVRPLEVYDGAVPSGNSVGAQLFIRLARLTGDSVWEDAGARMLTAFSATVARSPSAFTRFLQAVDHAHRPGFEVVIAGERDDPQTRRFLSALQTRYLPGTVVLLRDSEHGAVTSLAPFVKNQRPVNGRTTAYVCRDFACKRPTNDLTQMLHHLGEVP